MKIGIIGSGDVAQSLGKGLSIAGDEVMLGTRHPEKLQDFLQQTDGKAIVGSSAEAATFGELVILAVKGTAADKVLPELQTLLAGKTVIDVTNPLIFDGSGSPGLSVGHNNSGGEVIQGLLPESKVVKALNIISHTHMVQPQFEEGTPTMFIAGNDVGAKQQVTELLKKMGWDDLVDLGSIEKSRLLEPLCLLWVEYGLARNTWDHAFAVLKK